jgi:hypothetical protein
MKTLDSTSVRNEGSGLHLEFKILCVQINPILYLLPISHQMSNLYAPHILNHAIIYNNGDKTGSIIEEYYAYKRF